MTPVRKIEVRRGSEKRLFSSLKKTQEDLNLKENVERKYRDVWYRLYFVGQSLVISE